MHHCYETISLMSTVSGQNVLAAEDMIARPARNWRLVKGIELGLLWKSQRKWTDGHDGHLSEPWMCCVSNSCSLCVQTGCVNYNNSGGQKI